MSGVRRNRRPWVAPRVGGYQALSTATPKPPPPTGAGSASVTPHRLESELSAAWWAGAEWGLEYAVEALEAEAERERRRIQDATGADPVGAASTALHNWVCAWRAAARHVRDLATGLGDRR